jgi:alpha-N-acetylglucosamine transferase
MYWNVPSVDRRFMVWICIVSISLWMIYYSLSPSPIIDHSYGLLTNTTPNSRYAIATFLAGSKNRTFAAEYFTSLRVLTYQLLHANETRCSRDIPFVITVTSEVPQYQRDRLVKDGAQVVPVEDVPLKWWTRTRVAEWKDQFTKLRILQMVQYDRILYIDADTFLTRPVDGIFDQPMV